MVALATSALLVGCSAEVEGEIDSSMGNASPAPATETADPAEVLGMAKKIDHAIVDAAVVRDSVVLKTADRILAGPINNPAESMVDYTGTCGDLAAAENSVLLPCDDGIRVLDTRGQVAATVGRGTAYSAAAEMPGGRIVGHRADSDVIDVFGADGELADEFRASRVGSQLVVAPAVNGTDTGRIMEVNRQETSVHELKIDESRAGSGLRAGLGVGKAAAGSDIIAAADTKGNQLLVYTMTDIIRLHQAAPVPESPWSVAVDESRNLIWVSSTAANKLTAWDISSGTPVQVAEVDTIADPQAMVVTAAGEVAVFSASGQGAQILQDADVEQALADYREQAEANREAMQLREPTNRLPSGAASNDAGDSAPAGDSQRGSDDAARADN